MNKIHTSIAALVGILLGGGIVHFGTTDAATDAVLADTQDDKANILADYVYAEARLNEVPTVDLSTASTEEISAAYTKVIEDRAIETTSQDLFIDLHAYAVKTGEACK